MNDPINKVSVILPAAGNASRMNGIPKTRYRLNGKEVLLHSLSAFREISSVGECIVAVKTQELDEIKQMLHLVDFPFPVKIVAGGTTRQESVWHALSVSDEAYRYMAVHDAARPLICQEEIEAVFQAAFTSGAATLGVPVKDTIKLVQNGAAVKTLPREELFSIQTPQVFQKALYQKGMEIAAASGGDYTDDCQIIEAAGFPITVVNGSYQNLKLTTPEDLVLAKAILSQRTERVHKNMRIGHGYDVHRLKEGRKLILGGVEISHNKGLDGHSDADVLVHAIIDGLFGALSLGDIGTHFPDTDDRYRGADSLELLREACSMIRSRGYEIGNIDSTILAQEPKLAPYISQMKEQISAACRVDPSVISIKATTEEHLGFTGNKEGIAAHAVCLLISV